MKAVLTHVGAIYRREPRATLLTARLHCDTGIFVACGCLLAVFPKYFWWKYGHHSAHVFWSSVFMLLIPAITMRLFAEEHRTGSIERGHPSSWRTCHCIGQVLGGPDPGVRFHCAHLVIPHHPDVFERHRCGSHCGRLPRIVGIGRCFYSHWHGRQCAHEKPNHRLSDHFDDLHHSFASGFALAQVPPTFLPLVQFLSFETHFNNLARGVIDSRDLLYYISIVGLFLHAAVFGLERRRLL